jgi:RNA polymerase primary sigma factor
MRSSTVRRRHDEGETNDSLTTYLEAIRAYPLLAAREEIELARRIRAGDADACERLVCANLRFVVSVAKKYQHMGVPLGDLINEGNIGLMRAARRFDETKGVRFISYAVWWIRQAVFQALARHSRPVRIPVGKANTSRRQLPGGREVAVLGRSISLDAPIGDDSSTQLIDVLPDEASESPDEPMLDGDLADVTEQALTVLSPRELDVTRRYFGLDGFESATLEQIGERFGITRERVRQIKDRALRKIRESPQAAALASFHHG